mmetsp:Transcript_51587/g.138005  ORF Transcript_51587/g.138005 Transcript_51587/m.138005 type:complete len:123 (-) Transcript_51587:489-857(-)
MTFGAHGPNPREASRMDPTHGQDGSSRGGSTTAPLRQPLPTETQQKLAVGTATPAHVFASAAPGSLHPRQLCEHQEPKRHWSLQLSTPYWPAFTKHAAQPALMPALLSRQEDMWLGWKLNHE